MVFSGEVGQQFYAQEMAPAIPGQLIGMGQYSALPYVNSAFANNAVYTVTPPSTVDANTTYTLSIANNVVGFTTGLSTTPAQLGQGLYNAIRVSGTAFRIVDAALNLSTGVITLTVRFYNTTIAVTSPSNSTTTNDLTIAATNTISALQGDVPFGRFVGNFGAPAPDPVTGIGAAGLYGLAGAQNVVGITIKDFVQKNAIGPGGKAAYRTQSVMAVLTDCVSIQGIWMECVEPDITPNDLLYICTDPPNQGKAMKSPGIGIDFYTQAKFINSTQLDPNGNLIVGVYLKRM